MAELQALSGIAQGGAKIWQGGVARSAARSEADATEQAAAVEAAGMRARAAETRAAAGMDAREKRRAAEVVMGRQVAVAADSGAGTGGTFLDILGETAGRSELQAQGAMYRGEQQARGLEDRAEIGAWKAGTQARSSRQKGDAAFAGSIFEGGSKIVDSTYKYGDRNGWWDRDKTASDDTDPRTGWRTRVYKART